MIELLKKRALLSTVLTAVIVTPAFADTTVGSDSTTPLVTSSAGDIEIEDEVELDVESTAPITINSNNSVTIGEDAVVQADDDDGRAGILVTDGVNFSIVNDGYILVTEDYVPEDGDSNGVADGAIAEASGRFGIHILPGASGSIENSGTIFVEGLNSYGIVADANFEGDIATTGVITVIGDYSTAVSLQSVDGDLALGGTISAVGEGATAVSIAGDVSGTLLVNGAVSKAASFSDDDGDTLTLSRSDMKVVSSAMTIAGDVDGGIWVYAPPYDLDDSDTDENDNGTTDSSETSGVISASGASPALIIGGASDTVIGSVQGRDGTFSLAVDGGIYSNAYYSDVDANALVIGGQGGNVTMADGIGVSGTIQATTVDSSATAITIHAGSIVPSLYNSGTIRATIQSSGEGSAYGIRDLTGGLTAIDNTGTIVASGSNEDIRNAVDVSLNTTGVTIKQYLNDMDAETKANEEEDEDYDPSSPTIYSSIIGDIRFGSGDDLLDVATGYIQGDTYFGTGNDEFRLTDDALYVGDLITGNGDFTMELADTARFYGTLDAEGQAAQVTISDDALFSGDIVNGGNVSVDVDGGVIEAADGETMVFDTLNVSSGGAISVILDGENNTTSSFDVGTANFEDGSFLNARVTSLADAEGTYTVLTADTLTGLPELDLSADYALPLLYTGTIEVDDNSIILEVERRTAEELGLTRAQGEAFDAIIAQALEYEVLEGSLLQAEDLDTLTGQIDGLLPDYSGGVFDFVTRASRLASRHLTDAGTSFDISPVGAWLEPFYFRGSKTADETAGFKTKGFGFTGGMERDFGFGYLGLAFTWAKGSVTNGDLQDIDSDLLELAGHWRMRSGPLYAYARVAGGKASMSSTRTFEGTYEDTDFAYQTAGDWKGWLLSASGGATYDLDLGRQLTLRPKAVVDYYLLKEDGYEESGADIIDLFLEDRTSKSLAATTSLTLSYSLGAKTRDRTPLTLELEGGYRSVLSGELGTTVANFEDGDSFSLTPGTLKGGWTSEARIRAGGFDYNWQLAVGAEKTQGDIDMTARAGLSVAF